MRMHRALSRDVQRPLALAIGFFDGLHAGHREVAHATQRMRKPGWRSGVLTFSNHPAAFLRPGSEPTPLSTPEERIDRFASAGFEECFFVPFDETIASLEPQEFLDMLYRKLGVRAIAVGQTFRFGHKRVGGIADLEAYALGKDLDVCAVPSVSFDGERVSSTRIRELVAAGEMERAAAMLGYEYEVRGVIEVGEGRGHGLGFPTANLRVPNKLLPRDGVYSGVARYDGRDFAALVSIGANPHFNGEKRTLEAWLRDFHSTIYGEEVSVRALRFVREQSVFASADELIAQMQRDLAAVAYPSFS